VLVPVSSLPPLGYRLPCARFPGSRCRTTLAPVIPPFDPATGLLPLGRHVCSADEVEIAFVKDISFFGSATRLAIWNDWNDALATLQSVVTVHAAWIGGSFTTSKLDPGDIDVTFIINGADMQQRSTPEQRTITLFDGNHQVEAVLGLKVDSYVIPWECLPVPAMGMSYVQDVYFWARGYWDDWWQRARQTPKGSPPVPADALPRRGYLEVLVSDYIC
jgi:hypothetical protein